MNIEFMKKAIELAEENIKEMSGGPFGSVVVKDGKIIGASRNLVLKNNDATAHGEVSAIRDAGSYLKNYDLSGCDLYTSCEPCPMCLMAASWANIKNIYFAATREDADKIGFRDEHLYEKLKKNITTGIHIKECQKQAINVMKRWHENSEAKIY